MFRQTYSERPGFALAPPPLPATVNADPSLTLLSPLPVAPQVSVRAPCCKRWFDCPECHAEQSDHNLRKTSEMVFACKKCKKVFRKDLETFDEADEYCPNCDNHYIIDAKTPQMAIGVEGDDPRLNRDYREAQKQIIENDFMSDRLG